MTIDANRSLVRRFASEILANGNPAEASGTPAPSPSP